MNDERTPSQAGVRFPAGPASHAGVVHRSLNERVRRDRHGVEIAAGDRVAFGPDALVPLDTVGIVCGAHAPHIDRNGDRDAPVRMLLARAERRLPGGGRYVPFNPLTATVLRRDGRPGPEGRRRGTPATATVEHEAAEWRFGARDHASRDRDEIRRDIRNEEA